MPFTITHRIVEIREEGVVTKGDNLEEADGVVKWEWVRYRIKYADDQNTLRMLVDSMYETVGDDGESG